MLMHEKTCVIPINFLFCLGFFHYMDVLFNNYDLRSSDVKKTSILASKFNILRFVLVVSMMFMCFSNDKKVQ